MQFIDEVKIYIKSGSGGNGCLSFRREANVPYGGPDGGNGGNGGDVIAICVEGLNTLIDYRFQQHFKAQRGEDGKGKNRNGISGKDIILKVPLGTQFFIDGEQYESAMYADMVKIGQKVVLARGGKGGVGNSHFKSSVNQAPRKTTKGVLGQELTMRLQLKLFSDVGIIGLPNAGKSTFLSITSRAKPKIADYPFTTLVPKLGVVYIDEQEFVLADIPGLIKDAHKGVGLGIRFLKHIERCATLIHLIDGTSENLVEHYQIIRQELQSYSFDLGKKEEMIVLNKIDALAKSEVEEKVNLLHKATNKKIYKLSAISNVGKEDVLRAALAAVKKYEKIVVGAEEKGSG